VIVIIWSGFDTGNNPTYKYCCPSIDSAGHTAEKAAQAVKNVLERTLGDDVEVFCATADAGGGGSIQFAYPKFKELGMMKEDSKETNCDIHGFQKVLENASKLTMGDQGLGTRTPFQMLWVLSRLMSEIRSKGGIQLIDRLWEIVNKELQSNEEWRTHADKKMQQTWNQFLTKVEVLEEHRGERQEGGV
jgi:hypothetical protein